MNMQKVAISEVLDIAEYERQRQAFRHRIIQLKRRRRVSVGPTVTFVFENHETILFQVQEMMRAERIVDEAAIQHELDTYNPLLPEKDELAATMLIEVKDSSNIRAEITRFHGVDQGEATYLQIGNEKIPGIFASGQSDEQRISAVQYVRFQLSPSQRDAVLQGPEQMWLVIEHPNYHHRAHISDEVRDELKMDLRAP